MTSMTSMTNHILRLRSAHRAYRVSRAWRKAQRDWNETFGEFNA